MADEALRPIVVKRVKKGAGGRHGGAWKIAYADFVTAMMAFFLLMWLLGSTSQGDLQGIAEYFQNPLRVSMSGGSGSGDSTSVIQGGGTDLTRQSGQIRKGDVSPKYRQYDLDAARAELERLEIENLKALKARIEAAIEANPKLAQFRNQLLIDITTEGLRIQIVDAQNRPMFALASARLEPHTVEILHEIGRALNDVTNRISLSGHTDAKPYFSGNRGYSNWELSADRANASRRELIAGGMDDKKVLRVVGLSSAVLLDREDPFNPINRRISIIVMNRQAEEAAASDGGVINEASAGEASAAEVAAGAANTGAAGSESTPQEQVVPEEIRSEM